MCEKRIHAHHQAIADRSNNWKVTRRMMSEASIQMMCSTRTGVPRSAIGIFLEMLLAGFDGNPDWRKRESLVMLAGAITNELSSFAQDHAEVLNSLLIHICKALGDLSVSFPYSNFHTHDFYLIKYEVQETACRTVGNFYIAAYLLLDYLHLPLDLPNLVMLLGLLAWGSESAGVSIAAFEVLTDFVKIPLRMPYEDIIQKAEEAIPKVLNFTFFPNLG